MDDIHLDPLPLPVNDSDLFEPFLLTLMEVFLQKGRNLSRRESVKVDPIFDGNADNHNDKG